LGTKDKEFAKIKPFFAAEIFHGAKLVALDDGTLSFFFAVVDRIEDIIYERLGEKIGKEVIALDHPDRSPGRKLGFGEKGISIKS
jgi:hypothetical protein